MHKIVTITAATVTLAAAAIAAPTGAHARFGAGAIAEAVAAAPSVQPTQYYGGYRSYRPRYSGGGYYDYRRSGYASSRDALDTCAYC
jgi:hypothetical protein